MKKILSYISTKSPFACTVGSLALIAASLPVCQAAGASTLKVRFAWYMPPHTAVAEQGKAIAKKIDAMSNGSIKVKTYPSGSLFNESNIAQGVQNNTANMGIWGIHWWSSKIPAFELGTIPFLVNDANSLLKKLHGKLGHDLNSDIKPYGVKIIGWGFYGYAKSYVNSEHPIKVPSDLKGLKLRSEGKLSSSFLKSQGATPVAMDSSEVYTALQRGTLDGAISGMSSIVSRKWYEVGKYITAIHYVPLMYPIQVNLKWWKGLTDQQRKTIQKAVKSTEGGDVSRIEKGFKRDIKIARKHGDHVYRPSKANLKKWRNATLPMEKKIYLKNAGAKGKQLLNDIKAAKSGSGSN